MALIIGRIYKHKRTASLLASIFLEFILVSVIFRFLGYSKSTGK
jgi:hypothetical protein